ncbi:uncharacterized protein LOC129605155 [Condylostylus longicornis]|uniref:uncharacterized protein LOC129605155 n=1 Tax=Condylostylus longicornis TaxID=2530218 RepID=UPI00244DD79F|nr:uncharacterized protein LOC129605155 [Condylostylus longicornis]
MDQLVKKQVDIKKAIQSLKLEYDRLAEERKTSKLVREKQTKLDKLWQEFEMNDESIRTKHGKEIDHDYFTKDLYNALSLKVDVANNEPKENRTRDEVLDIEEDISEDLKIVIKKCQRSKFALNKLLNEITINNQSKPYYEMKIQQIQSKLKVYQDKDSDVCSRIDVPERLGYDPDEFFADENEAMNLIQNLREQLDKMKMTEQTEKPLDNIKGKLPAITLPKFDGEYTKWIQFRDLFTQIIDVQAIPQVEKMWYLKTNLIGEAEKLIRHLPISDQNYNIAWKILTERYDNKRLLVSSIIDKFLNQPSLTPGSSKSIKQMFDTTNECVLSLENSGFNVVGSWDPILLQIIYKKLDRETYSLYELSLKQPKEIQSLEKFLNFIEKRFQSLEAFGNKQIQSSTSRIKSIPNYQAATFSASSSIKCAVCNNGHFIFSCPELIKMTTQNREAKIRALKLCINCLRPGHIQKSCVSRKCKKCNQRHHTLLHQEKETSSKSNQPVNEKRDVTASVHMGSNKNEAESYVFLGTALVTVRGPNKRTIDCRVLMDSGSQLNFISERLQKQLKLDTRSVEIDINGIGNVGFIPTTDRVNVTIESKVRDFNINIDAQVIKEITKCQPQRLINIDSWNIPENLTLSDPNFNKPQRIDMLLGAEVYGDLIRSGKVKLKDNLPTLHETVFGWMILGKASNKESYTALTTTNLSNQQLSNELEKFWECEEILEHKPLSKVEMECEEFFKVKHKRDKSGRFIVKLPILSCPNLLGESKHIAFRRFLNLERKLSKDAILKSEYTSFLREYLELGHMTEIELEDIPRTHYFMPHHGVIRESSSSTKLRVVFDASCKTTSGVSLNDIMMKGPKVQSDLFNILLRFRMYKYVVTADIKQMYRQIMVADEDRKLQMIMWRSKPQNKIKYYQLNTVTYGTRSAPYLATRCLTQLSIDEKLRYPVAAKAVRDFYVDDIISGSDTMTAQLKLHKWGCNDPRLLSDIPEADREKEKVFKNDNEGYIKTLGLCWQPSQDVFSFITAWPDIDEKVTKRKIISEVSRLFDPLGLVNPVIVVVKIFIQKLWKLKHDWDDELENNLKTEWIEFRQDLSNFTSVKISRYMFISQKEVSRTELHVFSDASERAFGAAAYIRSIDSDNNIKCKLLCSKSKVAPIKFITLPRLELCAAHLASKLMSKVQQSLNYKFDEMYLWSDSQIVLSWINGDPSVLKTFVAHRVSLIHKTSSAGQWNYVNTKSNPADLLSRGMSPDKLNSSELWFLGPPFLKLPEHEWPDRRVNHMRLQEEEKKTSLVLNCDEIRTNHPLHEINHRNSFAYLLRVMAYILRFINKTKKNNNDQLNDTSLSTTEINQAMNEIIKEIQRIHFSTEIRQLEKEFSVPKHSKIVSLSPFLDLKGILRVGGRLDNADISYNAKYPILLPGTDFVSKLLMIHLHEKNLHAGPLALLSISRQKFWIINGRALARTTVNNCVNCAKAQPQLLQQLMGSLPAERVLPARAFLNTGVDFCGPIWTHYHVRGKRPHKSYIAVFCCFTTKAIHLEAVSDLTTEAFLGALKRFIGRRGVCKNIFCDNATNFVGAKNKLEEVKKIFEQQENKEKIIKTCSNNGIQFNFSPPRSPHFGGLWEAAVKSTKKLLRQTLKSASLTYEELSTVLAEAEAVLNSRPLTPLSSSPNDYCALTPGHFLIGEPLTAIPETEQNDKKLTLLSRWKLVSAIRQEFWKRWNKEYLTQLQQRYQWNKSSKNISKEMMVIIKDENHPPLKWRMGRIEDVCKGPDGFVRVVKVRTANGILERAIHNLAPLPIETDNENTSAVNGTSAKRTAEKRHNTSPKRIRYDQPFSTVDHRYTSLLTQKFEHQLHEINETNQLLFSRQSFSNKKKRGLLNIVGNVANVLFGVLDDEYAKNIEGTIEAVKHDHDHLLQLMKEQTSVIEATNHLIKESHEQSLINFKRMQTELNGVIMNVNQITSYMQKYNLTQSVLFFSQYLHVTINEFRRMQNKMVDIITDLHEGRVNPLILAPKQLSEHLEFLRPQLESNIMLPKLAEIYGLSSAKCKINNKYAVFSLKVPLLSISEYDVLHLVPFPVKLNNVYMRIEPTTEYIIINKHRDIIYTLSRVDFKACIYTENKNFICRRERPFFTKNAQNLQFHQKHGSNYISRTRGCFH